MPTLKYCLLLLVVMLVQCSNHDAAKLVIVTYDESPPELYSRSEVAPRFSAAFWSDGRVVWKKSDGSSYLSAQIDARKIQELLDRFARKNASEETSFRHSWVGPDSCYATIWLASGSRHICLKSWHEEFEKNPRLVVLSSGVSLLGCRTRGEVLSADTIEYQSFRRAWADLRSAIDTLVPDDGECYDGPLLLLAIPLASD